MTRGRCAVGCMASTAAFLSLLAAPTSHAQPTRLEPVYVWEMPVDELSDPFTMAHGVLSFPAGSTFPDHRHGGPGLYGMVSGGVSVEGDIEADFAVGESYVQNVGQTLSANNANESRSIMAVDFVIPEGAELTTFVGGPDSSGAQQADMLHNIATEPIEIAGPFTIVSMVIEIAPGEEIPEHSYTGPSLATVVEGVATLDKAGVSDAVAAGEGWAVGKDEPIALQNTTTEPAVVSISYLLPEGATAVHSQ